MGRLRCSNLQIVRLRSLNPRRHDFILDLKLDYHQSTGVDAEAGEYRNLPFILCGQFEGMLDSGDHADRLDRLGDKIDESEFERFLLVLR